MPLRQVLEIMADISGRRVRCIHVNGKIAEMVTATLEFIADHVTRRPPSGTAEGVRIALRAGALSIEKAQRELGYAPGPVEPVLREAIAHLLDAGHHQPEWSPTPSGRARSFHIERRFGG
jgi:dihydroflavonol-4-reductase